MPNYWLMSNTTPKVREKGAAFSPINSGDFHAVPHGFQNNKGCEAT